MRNERSRAYDPDGKRKYLTREEGVVFLRAARKLDLPSRLLCETLYYTGCRISEALALELTDVDEGTLRIACLKKRKKPETRRVPTPAALLEELRKLPALSGSVKLWPQSRTTAWRIVKTAMGTAGIQGIQASPKGLRHGFGVRAAMGKVPVNVIQRWMGHADPNTTSIYLAVRDDEERELIKRTW